MTINLEKTKDGINLSKYLPPLSEEFKLAFEEFTKEHKDSLHQSVKPGEVLAPLVSKSIMFNDGQDDLVKLNNMKFTILTLAKVKYDANNSMHELILYNVR